MTRGERSSYNDTVPANTTDLDSTSSGLATSRASLYTQTGTNHVFLELRNFANSLRVPHYVMGTAKTVSIYRFCRNSRIAAWTVPLMNQEGCLHEREQERSDPQTDVVRNTLPYVPVRIRWFFLIVRWGAGHEVFPKSVDARPGRVIPSPPKKCSFHLAQVEINLGC